MQAFQVVQKNYDLLGFNPDLEFFNHNMLSFLMVSTPAYALLLIYLFHEANSSQEYMESAYASICCGCIFLSLISIIFMRKELYSFLNGFNEALNESM